MPSTPNDAKGLLKAAIRDENPVIFIEPKSLYNSVGEVNECDDFVIELGVGDIKKEGDDITVVSYGKMLPMVLEVAYKLQNKRD